MQQILWIVDGNNLIHRDRELARALEGGSLEAAKRLLEGEIARFRARRGRGHSVLLVYDGAPPQGAPKACPKGLRILHPSRGGDADQVIVREARRHEGRPDLGVRVVTSDRGDIALRLRGLQVAWYSIERFSPLLWEGREEGEPDGAPGGKPAPPRGSEVDFWLERFGGGE
ncbi:MAG: NYN domain-containing protein [Planctomycetota bacterium]